jgi:hypothetical protein
MSKRSAFLLLTVALMAAFLSPTRPSAAAQRGRSGVLAFMSNALSETGNWNIYTIEPYGKGYNPQPPRKLIYDPPWAVDVLNEFDPAVSPDGQRVAYSVKLGEHPNNPSTIQISNLDGSGTVWLGNPGPRYDYEPAWSPDGTQIAYTFRQGSTSDIYIMKADGSGRTNLTTSTRNEVAPAWSPDGTKIAFAAGPNEEGYDIYVMNTDGSGLKQLTSSAGFDSEPAWSPDGLLLAFTSRQPWGSKSINVMKADGTERRLAQPTIGIPANLFSPAWSPDGTKIAFAAAGLPGFWRIYMANANVIDTLDWTQIADLGGPSTEAPDWQPVPRPTPDASDSCTYGDFGSGRWPGACWRPYAASSPFNTPLPPDVRNFVRADSTQIMARIHGDISSSDQPANLLAHLDGSSGEPTYWSRPIDPVFVIHCVADPYGREKLRQCPLENKQLRIPAGAHREGGQAAREETPPLDKNPGDDRHITVVDQTNNLEYDLWQAKAVGASASYPDATRLKDITGLPPQGGHLFISWGAMAKIDGQGIQQPNTDDVIEEFQAAVEKENRGERGVINHALFIVINCDNGTFVYPANGKGRACANPTDAPPMGSLFWLDMSPERIDQLTAPAWKKVLLRTMATYGMYFGDTGTSFLFTIETEAGIQYSSFGYNPDRWEQFAQVNSWFLKLADQGYPWDRFTGPMGLNDDNIDWRSQVWSNLRVLDKCIVDPAC